MSISILHASVVAAMFLVCVSVGGGLYEHLVVDPFWPKRPDLIQPNRGGIVRGRFWLLVHTLFEVVLILTAVQAWGLPNLRFWLLIALTNHAVARIWSAFDFIPKALAFEKADAVDEAAARRWARRSWFRLPLGLLTLTLLFGALRVAFSR